MYADDIMVLDTGNEMYLWIGNDSSEDEKKNSYLLAKVIYNLYKSLLFIILDLH